MAKPIKILASVNAYSRADAAKILRGIADEISGRRAEGEYVLSTERASALIFLSIGEPPPESADASIARHHGFGGTE
ncbi:hypothetical protein [Shumkonia mesophila]|uniref:hypothetical protein n=1 Tax=Shumkonia mesophila TaxID=2838854 RepID=UPI0029342BFF|nr:hypothetical protein [Shumkonia mesophila]